MESEETYRVAEIVFSTLSAAAGFPVQERDWDTVVVQWQKSRSDYPMVEAAMNAALKIQATYELTLRDPVVKN